MSTERYMTTAEIEVSQSEQVDLQKPPQFAVVLLNDDRTTMDFVVDVLREVFFMSEESAHILMLRIHTEGEGIAGVFMYDIAHSKQSLVIQKARQAGFPLQCILREVK